MSHRSLARLALTAVAGGGLRYLAASESGRRLLAEHLSGTRPRPPVR